MFNSPNAKAYAAGTMTAAIYVLSWALETYAGTVVPEPVQAAAAVVLTSLVTWVVPNANV